MLRAALLNHRRLALGQPLDLSPLRKVVDLDVFDDVQGDEIATVAKGRQVLITKEVKVDADVMAELRNGPDDKQGVQLICEAGTGYNNLDLATAGKHGITICNVPGYSTEAVAQLTMSFLLGIASGTLGFVRRTSRGDYAEFTGDPAPSFELRDKVLGVIGPGAIGLAVAQRARVFGMRVLTHSRTPRTWPDPEIRSASMAELLARSDFVTLHCPLVKRPTPEGTWHVIDRTALASMKRGAWLLNVSRGGLVDELALVDAVQSGHLSGAALDVHELEPAEPRDELRLCNRIFLTPHVGWKAVEARQRLIGAVAESIRAFQAGRAFNVVT